jgi:hypothetical protein
MLSGMRSNKFMDFQEHKLPGMYLVASNSLLCENSLILTHSKRLVSRPAQVHLTHVPSTVATPGACSEAGRSQGFY